MKSNDRAGKIPVHLQNYDLFMELIRWKAADVTQARNWMVTSLNDKFRCLLLWTKVGTIGHIDYQCPSPEEAVHKALEEFNVQINNVTPTIEDSSNGHEDSPS